MCGRLNGIACACLDVGCYTASGERIKWNNYKVIQRDIYKPLTPNVNPWCSNTK